MATDILSRLRNPQDPLSSLSVDDQLSPEASYQMQNGGESQFIKGLRTGVAGMSAGSFADDALDAEAAGEQGWQGARDNAMGIMRDSAMYRPRVNSLRDIRSLGDAGDFAAGAFGQGLASMAPTLAVGMLTRGQGLRGLATAFGSTLPVAYQMERGEQALNQYSDPVQAAASAADRDRIARNKGLVNAGLESLVPATLGRVGIHGTPASYLGRVGTGMAEEGLTEGAQQVSDMLADRALNDKRQLDPWEVADAVAMGALTGGGVSAGGNAHMLVPPGGNAQPDVATPAPAPVESSRIAPEDIPANGLNFADSQPEVPKRTDGVPLGEEPSASSEPGDESPYDRLLRTMNERFGPSVQAGVGKAGELAGKAKAKAEDVADRLASAVEESKTPQEFFQRAFGSDEDSIEPLVLGDEDPKLAGATLDETQANMQERRASNTERAAKYADELMQDPDVSQSVRYRVASFGGEYSQPEVQRYIGTQRMARQASAKLSETTKRFVDFAEKQKGKLAPGRIKRNNLMDATPDEKAQFTRLVFDGLTDEAKADPKLMDKLPELASAMVALSSRVGDLDNSDLNNLSEIHGGLGLFKDPETLAAQIGEVAGITEPGSFVSKILKISGAKQDVSKSNSFLYSMLSEGAKDSMTTRQLGQLADFIDSFGLRSAKEQDKSIKALGLVFGSPERARMVLDYYRQQNKSAAQIDDSPAEDDDNTAAVDTADSGETGYVDHDSNVQGINEGAMPKSTYVFKDAKSRRPFRVDLRSQAGAGGREMVSKNELGGNTNRTPIPMSQYVKENERDPEIELQHIVSDINKRLGEALRGLASEYGIAKPKSDDAQREAFERAMRGEASPNPKSTRIENIKGLYGELSLLTKVQEESGTEAALDLYEVLKVEGNESLDLTASDEDIAAMGVDRSGRGTKTSTITFVRKDGSKLALNAEAIWEHMAKREGPGGGEKRLDRIRRLFAEGVASVLNRDDIAGLENSKELLAGGGKAKVTQDSIEQAVLRNRGGEEPVQVKRPLNVAKIRETLANLKNSQVGLAELKAKLKRVVDAYADAQDVLEVDKTVAKDEMREQIRSALERSQSNYQRDIDDVKSQESAYWAAKEQGKTLKPSSALAFNKPAQAVVRRKLGMYRDALDRINSVDFEEAMAEAEATRAGMPGMDETGPYGKAKLNRTVMNEQTLGDVRNYEEDTGLGVGSERRGSNPSAPMDEGEGKTKVSRFRLGQRRKPAAAFGGKEVLAEKPANEAKVRELTVKLEQIKQRVANNPGMSSEQKQELREHYADLQAELNAVAGDQTKVAAEIPPGDRLVSKRQDTHRKRDARLSSIVPADDRAQSAADAAIKYLDLLDKQGRPLPNQKRTISVLKRIAAMGDFMAELASGNEIFDFDKMNATHVPGLLRMMQQRFRDGQVEDKVQPVQEPEKPIDVARLSDLAVKENWGKLQEPADVVAYAEEARTAYDKLRATPEEQRSEDEDRLLWALDNQFKTTGFGAFDWASLFDGMDPSREDYEAVLKAVQGKQSSMRPKRGRPAKVDQKALQAIVDEIRRTRGPDVKVIMSRAHSQLGGSGEWSMNADKTGRAIEIATNAVNPMSVAWHESLHDFFGMLGEDFANRSVKRDLIDASNAPHVKRQLRKLLEKHPEALKQIESDAEERVAYMYQFWAEGVLTVGPTGTGILQSLRNLFRDLLGLVSTSERAEDLLTALHDGRFAEPSTVANVLADLGSSRIQDKIHRLSPQLDKALKAMVQAAPDRLRSFQNDSITELAEKFSSESGETGFIQKRFQAEGKWENRLASLLAGTTAVERSQALRNLQAMKDPTTALEKGLVKYLDDMHTYMSKSGVLTHDSATGKWVPIRKVGNYFPRVFDRNAILENETEWRQLLKDNGVSASQIGKITKALTHGDGQLELSENEHSLGYTPFAQGVQDRKLTFIDKTNAHLFTKFQKRDLADIMLGYTKQVAHRAEYAAAFGNNGEEIQRLVEKSGIKNEKEIAEIMRVVQGLEGTIGYGMSSTTKEVMSSIMTLQNLVLLPLSLFSQMVDPITLAARTGDLADAGRAYIAALQKLRNHVTRSGAKIDGEELAEMLGVISQDSVLEAMGAAYGSSYMSSGVRHVNRVFFKYTGMQGWNSAMRITATRAGERYLLDNRDNADALKELGLTPKDIKFSTIAPGSSGKPVTRLDMTSPKVQQAMFRFVDQAVMRPSASQRPVWMSDPRFLLVAHLKQFVFTMQNVVLKRASKQLEEGNTRPWTILLAAMPVILAADMAKFALTGHAPAGWGFTDYVGHAISRSGLTGLGDFGNQMMNDAERGRLPGESLLGPTFEHAAMIMRWLLGDAKIGLKDVVARTVPGVRFLE